MLSALTSSPGLIGAFVGGLLTLLGVLIVQYNARNLLAKQLENNLQLKQMDLDAEKAKAVRRDRKDAYVNLLKAWEGSIKFVEKLGKLGIRSPQLKQHVERLIEQMPKLDEATIEVNAYGSRKVIQLAAGLDEALEKCLSAYDLEPQLLEANKRVQQELKHQRIRDQYETLLNQIRIELGVLNSPDLKATPEEIRALARKILEDTPETTNVENTPDTR
jgi:hypothetical protein